MYINVSEKQKFYRHKLKNIILYLKLGEPNKMKCRKSKKIKLDKSNEPFLIISLCK